MSGVGRLLPTSEGPPTLWIGGVGAWRRVACCAAVASGLPSKSNYVESTILSAGIIYLVVLDMEEMTTHSAVSDTQYL